MPELNWLLALLTGIVATAMIDLWASVLRVGFRLPTTDWGLVGRWFGHMPRGVFLHDSIGKATPIPHERAIGWIAHYGVGILYAFSYLVIVQVLLVEAPSLSSALVFGAATVAVPWLIMQPGLGLGFLASRAPRPNLIRLIGLSVHLVFGASLFLGSWLLAKWL